MNKQHETTTKLFLLVLFLTLAVYIAKYTSLPAYFNREVIQSFGVWAPLIFIIAYTIAAMLFIPGTILTFAGALLFGTLFGTLYTVIGATFGAMAAFSIARFGGRSFVARLLKGKVIRFDENIKEKGFSITLFFRLIPLFPYNVLNFALGLTKIQTKDYFFGTLLGLIPGTFVYTYLFATLGEKVLSGGATLADFLSPAILLPVLLFLLLLLIPLLVEKKTHLLAKRYTKR